MLRSIAVFLTLSAPAIAQVPDVITDIAPVQSLVARVMQGIGTPDVLLPPGASPHDYSLRPSDAERLAGADLVIWVGHGLTPWLEEPVETLAPDATQLELLATTGWTPLQVRTDPAFADAEPADDAALPKGADHDHSGTDPHAWLDPANAAIWMTHIAEALAIADPANAAAYRANAAAAGAEMEVLRTATQAVLAPYAGRGYVVPHDAYHYFETAFGMPAAGAISLTDATSPGPARISALQDLIGAGAVTCILTDPQTSPEWSALLAEGTFARTAFVDADGGSQQVNNLAELYPAIVTSLAAALAECLG